MWRILCCLHVIKPFLNGQKRPTSTTFSRYGKLVHIDILSYALNRTEGGFQCIRTQLRGVPRTPGAESEFWHPKHN